MIDELDQLNAKEKIPVSMVTEIGNIMLGTITFVS